MKKLTEALLLITTPDEAPNVQYACGFTAPDPVLYLKHGRKHYLVVPSLEVSRARSGTRQTIVWTPGELELTPRDRGSHAGWAFGALRRLDLKHVAVSPRCPVRLVHELQRRGIRVRVADEPLFPKREQKGDEEIRCIRETQRAAVHAMRRAWVCLRDASVNQRGYLVWNRRRLTSERLRFEIERTLLERQCTAAQTIVAGGAQGADPHERGEGPLRADQPIVLDIFPQHKKHGYWGDITRTVVKGTPRREVSRMFRAVKDAQAQALAMVRPGVKGSSIHKHVQGVLERHGFETGEENGTPFGFFHGTGHGVGLEIHEAPRVSLSDRRLRKGHVITVEPGLYYPAWGGMRIEDTVVVTRDGWDPLATLPIRLRV